MRLATIDLDWLDAEIERYEINLSVCSTESYNYWKATLNAFKLIRSKCIPIEEPFTLPVDPKAEVGITDSRVSEKCSRLLYGEQKELPKYCVVKNKEYCFLSGKCKECSNENLPKTCLNQWEDKKYCSNEGMCELCKINN